MKINPYIFRGYDLRGIAGRDLNEEIAEYLGKAFGTFLSRRGINKAVIGRDCRLTSESYSGAMIKGILSAGVDVIDIGLALAGIVYWAQYHFDAKGCVSVSGSHNPAEFNGFKFGTGYSATMVSDEIQELRKIAENGEFAAGAGKLTRQDIRQEYFADLLKRFDTPFNFKVVIDPSCSTPGAFVPELLKKAGCQVICQNCELDGSFPIGTPDPTEKIVAQRLAKRILAEKADIGFSYDSDGDRIGTVDGGGNILWNDILVALFAQDAISRNPGAKIVFNTLCSKVVTDTINTKNGQAIMWRTGHSFIKAKAQAEKAAFAGELSGHFYFLDKFYPHDDGCYSALALLSYLSHTNQTLTHAVSALPKYISSPEIKIYCADERKVELMAKIAPVLKKDFPDAEIIDDERAGDGLRLELSDAMFVVRYSQNGPYLTIKFEAKTQERYEQLKKYIFELLHQHEEIDWASKINVNVEAFEPTKTV